MKTHRIYFNISNHSDPVVVVHNLDETNFFNNIFNY